MKTTKKTVNKTVTTTAVIPTNKLIGFVKNGITKTRAIHKELGITKYKFRAVSVALKNLIKTGKLTFNVRTGYALPVKRLAKKVA